MKPESQQLGRLTVEKYDRRICGLEGANGTDKQVFTDLTVSVAENR